MTTTNDLNKSLTKTLHVDILARLEVGDKNWRKESHRSDFYQNVCWKGQSRISQGVSSSRISGSNVGSKV